MTAETSASARRAARRLVREQGPETVQDRWLPVHAGILAGVISFFVYLLTLAPAMHLGDGLELCTAAKVLGVPHPTGYPLYMLLLKIFTLIPLGSEIIARTAMFSALCSAGCAGITVVILHDLLRAVLRSWPPKALLIAALAGGLSSAFLRFHWNNSIVTEVYALELLLILVFIRIGQRFAEAPSPGLLIAGGLVLGLGLAHHRLSVIMVLPYAIMWFKAVRLDKIVGIRRAFVLSAAALLACLALYAYLPVRARANPAINWGNPQTLSRFMEHIRGTEYTQFRLLHNRPDQKFSAESYGYFASQTCRQLALDFAEQIVPTTGEARYDKALNRKFTQTTGVNLISLAILTSLFVVGANYFARSMAFLFSLMGLMALQNIAVVLVYNIADIRDYYLFAFWFAWLCVFLGVVGGLAHIGAGKKPVVASYGLLLLPAIIALVNFPRCNLRHDTAAEDLSAVALPESKEIMPEGSVLLTGGDQDIYTSWYRQIVRGERPDVLVFGTNFIYKPWYPAFFTREQIEKYKIRFAGHVARDPVEFTKQIRDGIVDANAGKVPLFTSTTDPYVLQLLSEQYTLKPLLETPVAAESELTDDTTVTLYRILPKVPNP